MLSDSIDCGIIAINQCYGDDNKLATVIAVVITWSLHCEVWNLSLR